MRASAWAPCTVGNFGPGFDVLSLALERRGDTVHLSAAPRDEVRITGPGAERIPREWAKNAACAAIDALRARSCHKEAVLVEIEKGMPPGSGLGSSASSCAADVRAFAQLHSLELTAEEALVAAASGELVASGGAHRDDVGAALFGGIVIVGGSGSDAVLRLRPPPMHLVVARPDVELPTREMRGLIPQTLPRGDVVHNLGNVARIAHACHVQDAAMLCRALEDRISRPYRAPKVPAFDAMRDAARKAGAQAYILSGSGPASIAAMPDAVDPAPVLAAMKDVMRSAGLAGDVFLTRPLSEVSGPGVRLH